MKSIAIIIPYFGHLPNYFPLFLHSSSYNPSVDWYIVTDDMTGFKYPENVHRIEMKFSELQRRVAEKFSFPVALETPYKLCDLKPGYGYIFSDLVKEYDYWGYGDLDLIYGDIRSFLTDEILAYPKVFTLGHFTLIRKDCTEMFMQPIQGEDYYKEIYSSPQSWNYDEDFRGRKNVNDIFREKGLKIYDQHFEADIYTKSSDFRLDLGDGVPEQKRDAFFLWNKGKLKRYIREDGEVHGKDYMYIHLQKRPMNVNVKAVADTFKIIPNSFDELEVPIETISGNFEKIRKKYTNMQYFRIRGRNLQTKLMMRLMEK